MASQAPLASVPPSTRLRMFHPGWFEAVLGTSIVGVAAFMNPGGLPSLRAPMAVVGVAMLVLAYVVAVGLGIPYVLRWARHPDAALRDLSHPVMGFMYATFPAGIVVLATATAAVGPAILPHGVLFPLVAILAVVGTPLAFAAGVALA